ncbi:MAG: TonB family protein [Bacteroidia bacterium]|nr:TonB family protein [Bacteroidia bacterium]
MKTMISFLLLTCLFFFKQAFSQTETAEPTFTPPKIKNIDVLDPVKYPLKAVTKKIEGTVKVEIEVDTTGKYVAHNIVESADSLLSAAVDPYIPQLKFAPALRGENPASAVVVIEIVFTIEKRVPLKTEIRVKY